MIRLINHPRQIRVDTTIKIIDKDGNETVVPVVVLIGLSKADLNKTSLINSLASRIFNREFLLDRRAKPKKPFWKFW